MMKILNNEKIEPNSLQRINRLKEIINFKLPQLLEICKPYDNPEQK